MLRADLKILTSKFRFIKGISDGSIDFKKMSKPDMIQLLKDKKFEPSSEDGDFDYLLRMPLWSLCTDKMNELEDQMTKKKAELETLEATTIKQIWLQELEILETAYKQELTATYSSLEFQSAPFVPREWSDDAQSAKPKETKPKPKPQK